MQDSSLRKYKSRLKSLVFGLKWYQKLYLYVVILGNAKEFVKGEAQ
jgi:hypothetical protein